MPASLVRALTALPSVMATLVTVPPAGTASLLVPSLARAKEASTIWVRVAFLAVVVAGGCAAEVSSQPETVQAAAPAATTSSTAPAASQRRRPGRRRRTGESLRPPAAAGLTGPAPR